MLPFVSIPCSLDHAWIGGDARVRVDENAGHNSSLLRHGWSPRQLGNDFALRASASGADRGSGSDDHGWWLGVVEFPSPQWSQGSGLTVGVMWLWRDVGQVTFDFVERAQGSEPFRNEAQFASVAA